MYDDLLSLSPEAMVSACRREGIHWLVIVKGRSGPVDESEQTVKVKSVLRGYEEEGRSPPLVDTNRVHADSGLAVPRSDLPSYFVHQMREQALVDESVSGSIDPAAVESTGTAEATKPLQDYFPILADEDVRHKGKHKQRTILVRHGESGCCPMRSVLTVFRSPKECRSCCQCRRRGSSL
jgi:translation initiation factor 2-alpha kinase 4